ncbi:MAG: hypothetical protein PHT51_00505 [Patescibacteria group bacterium]|nr:hypothetical protein [Patescibacteria group bacterium]MDD4611369.1 hypothetical protein [Patescibacteria group bacterium]
MKNRQKNLVSSIRFDRGALSVSGDWKELAKKFCAWEENRHYGDGLFPFPGVNRRGCRLVRCGLAFGIKNFSREDLEKLERPEKKDYLRYQRIVEAARELGSLSQALRWLKDLERKIQNGAKPAGIASDLVMLISSPEEAKDEQDNQWYNQHWRLFNKAVWETVMAHPKLMARCRKALKDSDRRHHEVIGEEAFGSILRKNDIPEYLAEFFSAKPKGNWF